MLRARITPLPGRTGAAKIKGREIPLTTADDRSPGALMVGTEFLSGLFGMAGA